MPYDQVLIFFFFEIQTHSWKRVGCHLHEQTILLSPTQPVSSAQSGQQSKWGFSSHLAQGYIWFPGKFESCNGKKTQPLCSLNFIFLVNNLSNLSFELENYFLFYFLEQLPNMRFLDLYTT